MTDKEFNKGVNDIAKQYKFKFIDNDMLYEMYYKFKNFFKENNRTFNDCMKSHIILMSGSGVQYFISGKGLYTISKFNNNFIEEYEWLIKEDEEW